LGLVADFREFESLTFGYLLITRISSPALRSFAVPQVDKAEQCRVNKVKSVSSVSVQHVSVANFGELKWDYLKEVDDETERQTKRWFVHR